MLCAVKVSTLLSKCLEAFFLHIPFHLKEYMTLYSDSNVYSDALVQGQCHACVWYIMVVCGGGGGASLTSVASLTRKSGSLSRFGE